MRSRPFSAPISPPATSTPSALPTPPAARPPPKRRLIIGAILGGALIIALAILGAIRFGGSGATAVVTPTPSVAIAIPTASSRPVVVATPTPTPVALTTPPPLVAIAPPIPAPTASPGPVVVVIPTPASTVPSPTVEATEEEPANKTFDGVWSVTLNIHDYKDPGTGAIAQGYVSYFAAKVKNGVLHGELGTRGAAAFFEINGKIDADGTAILHLNGLRGSEKYNMAVGGESHGRSGTPYAFDLATQFKGRRGTGKRIGPRVGIIDFVKD